MRPATLSVLLLLGCGSGGLPAGPAGVDAAAGMDLAPVSADAAPVSVDAAQVTEDAAPAEVDGGADLGTGVGKFCHELNRSGQPVTLTLEFGTPTVARISATTGRCAPPLGTPCTVIPAGRVPVRLLEGDMVLTQRDVILSGGGREYVFQAAIQSSTLSVIIIGGQIAPGTCAGLDFPADGGTD